MTPPLPNTFLGLPEEWSHPDRSRIVILPVPYEHTTSFGHGTGEGPASIIQASSQVELYDEELDVEIYQLAGGIATDEPLKHCGEDAIAVEAIQKTVSELIARGKTVVCLGGEHTISIGAVKAHAENYSDLSILQLDAHSDLRDQYEGNRYSHACVMSRIYEFHRNIVQVGIRSQCREEADFIKQAKLSTFYAFDLRARQNTPEPHAWHDAVIDILSENVYLTIDCDFFDPALMPAVGTPEPGGFGWHESITFLRRLSEKRRIVGFDVTELCPLNGLIHPQFVIAKLIYKLIGYLTLGRASVVAP